VAEVLADLVRRSLENCAPYGRRARRTVPIATGAQRITRRWRPA